MSGGCGDQPAVPQARWRQLAATPVAQDGGPLRITPAWWPPVPDDSALAAAAVHGTPVLGEGHIINGVEMVEASFLWRDDHRHGASPSVLIHLNTLTDNHRAHIAPALAARVPGTSWWALHVLLPQDALLSYRIVVTHDALPDDAGARRECWKRVHALGRPDRLNPDRLHDGFGLVSSLWVGPKAVLHPDWMSGLGASAERTGQALSRPQDEHAGYVLRFDLENEVLTDFDELGTPAGESHCCAGGVSRSPPAGAVSGVCWSCSTATSGAVTMPSITWPPDPADGICCSSTPAAWPCAHATWGIRNAAETCSVGACRRHIGPSADEAAG